VNLAFARAALEESGPDGVILIQDYHFALLPRLIRERAPRAASSIFWHIPWPHPDVIAILPWKERVLDGMLGADIIGFHTRDYCLRFMESAQRHAGAIVNFEAMTVRHRGRETKIRAYPISVEWPYRAATRERGAELRRSLGIAEAVHVGLGVDRADYTKGLLERIAAVEVLLERNPALTGRYSLVQLASPTRTRIPKYQRLLAEVADAAERVNGRFRNESWQPVVLQTRTFSQDEVREYYAMADSALVTPLHDGMNLVAKEYVAACEDGRGVLILSRFAGAAQELESALLVNPYDAEEIADALLQAMVMPSSERRARMETMRARIAAHSIYDWSEQIITDVRSVRRTAVYGPPRIAGVDQRLAVRP
jgi:trehalose 6-phosphate synthase